jgi:hypothetical protein
VARGWRGSRLAAPRGDREPGVACVRPFAIVGFDASTAEGDHHER